MRLSAQLAVAMGAASIAGIVVTGVFAIRTSMEDAETAAEEILLRDATGFANLVETWMVGQAETLLGWTRPFPIAANPALGPSLVQVVREAMPAARTVVLLDPAAPSGDLAARVPLQVALDARSATGVGRAIGTPWVPGDDGSPSVPIVVAGPAD